MMRRSSLVLALAALVPGVAAAQGPSLAQLFPHRAAIDAPPGLVRLPLPVEVLVGARADLSDVRVLDHAGAELPYLVDRGERPVPADAPRTISALPIDAERSTTRAHGISLHRETFALGTPGAPPAGAVWVLRVATPRARFVTRARIVWEQAPEGEREVARGALFRLGAPLREKLEIATSGLGRGRVRVELEGEDGPLEPSFAWLAVREEPPPTTLAIPLSVVETRREPGRTIVVVDRPLGVVPERVELTTGTETFVRAVDVHALDAATGRHAIGRGTVLRVSGVPEAEARSIDVQPARGARLELAIDDDDSRPLEALEVIAIVRRPSLVFEGERAALLRFGGGRVRAPSYDLQRLFGTSTGEDLLDRRLAGTATLGPVTGEPGFAEGPALAFAMRPGAEVREERFSHAAPLAIPEARDGLARVVLPADVLSAAREDLADLRVVDGRGAQRAYLLGDTAPPLEVALAVRAPDAARPDEEGGSRHALVAPVERIAPRAIELTVDAPFVAREVVVVGRDEEDAELELGRGWIVRGPREPGPLVVATSGRRVRALEVRVRDGDEAPLEIRGASARVPTRELFVTAPAGAYRLLAGDAEQSAPDYEIARARALVLAVVPAEAELGAVARNPSYVAPSWLEVAGGETVMVWAVLVLAVVVLGGVTLRVARREPEPTPREEGA